MVRTHISVNIPVSGEEKGVLDQGCEARIVLDSSGDIGELSHGRRRRTRREKRREKEEEEGKGKLWGKPCESASLISSFKALVGGLERCGDKSGTAACRGVHFAVSQLPAEHGV